MLQLSYLINFGKQGTAFYFHYIILLADRHCFPLSIKVVPRHFFVLPKKKKIQDLIKMIVVSVFRKISAMSELLCYKKKI